MPLHALARWSLRLILALCLGVAGLPAGAALHAKAAAPAAAAESAASMPCHGDMPADNGSSDDSDACDCCPQRSCDHVTCAIPACLPASPLFVAIAPASAPAPLSPAAPPVTALKPPLRPPIV